MFSSKPKNKAAIDLTRVQPSATRPGTNGFAEKTAPAPIQVLRPRGEGRRAVRKGLWCVCTIVYKSGEVREGVILDVSKTGARIRFRTRGHLPSTVKIKASRIGLNRFARVVWQSTFDAGLEFIPSKK